MKDLFFMTSLTTLYWITTGVVTFLTIFAHNI